jgi:glutamate 5-kinase
MVGVISGILVGANALVQLCDQLDVKTHLPWNNKKPPAIEQVQQPKSDVEQVQQPKSDVEIDKP